MQGRALGPMIANRIASGSPARETPATGGRF